MHSGKGKEIPNYICRSSNDDITVLVAKVTFRKYRVILIFFNLQDQERKFRLEYADRVSF